MFLLEIYLQRRIQNVGKHFCTKALISMRLFIVMKILEQSECSTRDGWLSKDEYP